MINWLYDWLNDWLVHRLMDWSIGWLIYWSIDLLVDRSIGWLIYWLIFWLIYLLIDRSIDWYIDCSIYWLTDWSIEGLIYWYILTDRSIDWSIYCLIYWLIDRSIDCSIDWLNDLSIDILIDLFIDCLVDWLTDWLVGRWMNNEMVEWLTGHYVCCVSSEMCFPFHKMHGRRTVCPVTWIAQNSRTDKCHINLYSFIFHILFKCAVERNDSEQLHQYGVLEYFTLPHFYHKLSCFTEVCTTLRPLLLFLSTALQLLVQSFGLLTHFLPTSSILDKGLPIWHF